MRKLSSQPPGNSNCYSWFHQECSKPTTCESFWEQKETWKDMSRYLWEPFPITGKYADIMDIIFWTHLLSKFMYKWLANIEWYTFTTRSKTQFKTWEKQ